MDFTEQQIKTLLPNFYKLKNSVARLEKDIEAIGEAQDEAYLSEHENMLRHEMQAIMAEVPGVGHDVYNMVTRRRHQITSKSMRDALSYADKILSEEE